MIEVLKTLDKLVTDLGNEMAKTEALNKQISSRKAELSEVERKQTAAATQLAARERVVGKLEDLEAGKKKLEENTKKLQEEKVIVKEQSESNIKKGVELQKAIDYNNKMQAIYQKKVGVLQEREAEIARREKIKTEILAELRKGI